MTFILNQTGDGTTAVLSKTSAPASTDPGVVVRVAGSAWAADCTGQEQTQVVTLSATAWEVSSLDVPAYATRCIITAPNAVTMYALNTPPVGPPTSGETRDGLRLAANQERVVQLAAGTSRTFQVASALESGVVTIQWVP